MINRMTVRFPALSQNELLSRMMIGSFASQLNPLVDELSDIKTAVSEAVTNAIVHGYRSSSGNVELEGRIYEGGILYISVKDKGCGIKDISQAREPLFTTGGEEERAGLGFTIMESFTDSLTVKSTPGKGTTVIMVKKLTAKG